MQKKKKKDVSLPCDPMCKYNLKSLKMKQMYQNQEQQRT